MSLYVLDTDTLSLWQHGHPNVAAAVASKSPSDIAVTVITVQEQIDGWHSRLNRLLDRKATADLYQRLANTVHFLSHLQILNFTEGAIQRYEILQSQKLNIGKMDLRIAAIVLEFDATIVTRNVRDFKRVIGLKIEDWSI